jgi:hypothetical protein
MARNMGAPAEERGTDVVYTQDRASRRIEGQWPAC